MQGRYRITIDEKGNPRPDPSWLPAFQLRTESQDTEAANAKPDPYFQVFQSEDAANLILTQDKESSGFAVPEFHYDHPLYKFGRKYRFGRLAYDESGELKSQPFSQPLHFEFSKHASVGDNLSLRWSAADVRKGSEKLTLKNNNQLSYGQINALGGDFFATLTPICLGSSFKEQCELFEKAYATLAEDKVGVTEATEIVNNRDKEVNTIKHAVDTGTSTSAAFKGLNQPSKVPGLDEADIDLTKITWNRAGPTYLRIAQLNLDHFGQDAHTAYNAGHTCAMRAATAGDLQLGYVMNAFADHFLGDSFAAGHVRTPRRKLHGNSGDVQEAIGFALDIINGKQKPTALDLLKIPAAVNALAPDICSKFMHDEDNSLGLWVGNSRGDQWKAYGDKKLSEEVNKVNKKLMVECLQASVDEVYKAFVARKVPDRPDEYAVWQIAPTKLGPGNHNPSFNEDGWYRKEYEYNKPKSSGKGYFSLAYDLSGSETFKKY